MANRPKKLEKFWNCNQRRENFPAQFLPLFLKVSPFQTVQESWHSPSAIMNDTFPMPDLSHLTEEERQNIMKVMQRHQAEEKRGQAGNSVKAQPGFLFLLF